MMNLCRIVSLRCRLAVAIVSGCLLIMTTGIVVAADVADIYQQDVPQMTTLECAKCHLQVFEALRDGGGLHQQQCRDCHDRFHTFTPGTPWEERVPACSSCHEFPHGEEMNICLTCHTNAHAPVVSMVPAEKLFDLCDRCNPRAPTTAGPSGEPACWSILYRLPQRANAWTASRL